MKTFLTKYEFLVIEKLGGGSVYHGRAILPPPLLFIIQYLRNREPCLSLSIF